MRVGIIGTGFGAHMASAFDSTRNCTVVEIVSPRDDDAVRALVSRTDIDLVSVHSPPFMHQRDVLLALESGHHVLCDKPFGHTVESARTMRDAAVSAGLIHLTNFELRHEPWRRTVTALIDGGTMGTVESVDWHDDRDSWRTLPQGWQRERAAGGGWLGASASHALDAIEQWIGPLRPTSATLRPFPDVTDPADIAVAVTLESDNGTPCTVVTSGVAARTLGRRIVVSGTRATAEVSADGTVTLHGAPWPDELDATAHGASSFGQALERWVGLVRDRVDHDADDDLPTFEDGLRCAELLAAVREVATH